MSKTYRDIEVGEILLEDVEFKGYPEWDNDSFDHEFGTQIYPSYPSMANSEVEWNKKKYTEEENKIIESYLANDKNYTDICEDLEQAFADAAKDY